MPNYDYRRFQPADQLVYDTQGKLVGVRSGTSGSQTIFGMNSTEYPAFQSLVSGAWITDYVGRMAVGDSLVAFGWLRIGTTSITAVGNLVTIVFNAPHGESIGAPISIQEAAQPEYNGAWVVSAVPTQTSLQVLVDTAPSVTTATGANVTNSTSRASRNLFAWEDFFSGGQYGETVNVGAGQQTTTQILARFDRDVIARKPARVSILAGINDIRYGLTQQAMLTAWDNLQEMYRRVLATGASLDVYTVPPVGSGDSGFATTTPLFIELNSRIRAWAAKYAGRRVELRDIWSRLVDNTANDGRAVAAYMADTVHGNALWAAFAAQEGAAPVDSGSAALRLVSSQFDNKTSTASSRNAYRNPLMLTSGGTIGAGVTSSGGGTTGIALGAEWTVAGSATGVVSLVPRTVADDGDTIGNNQRIVITAGAANDVATFRIPLPSSGIAEGLSVLYDFALAVRAASNVKYLLAELAMNVGGVSQSLYWNAGSSDGFPNALAPFRGVVRSARRKVNGVVAGSPALFLYVSFSAAGSATVDIGRARIDVQ